MRRPESIEFDINYLKPRFHGVLEQANKRDFTKHGIGYNAFAVGR